MNFKRKLWWVQHKDKIFRIYAITLTLVLVILGIIYFSYSKFSSSNEMTMYETTVEPFIKNDYFIASYIDGEWSDSIPGKNDGYEVDKIVCDNDAVGTWNSETWSINISNATKKIKCSIYFKLTTVFNFDYTGTEQVFTVPMSGTYKLETWGAQGGNSIASGSVSETGGMGGYSFGHIRLSKDAFIYINVGGKGEDGKLQQKDISGGYNGGGISHWDNYDDEASGGGGGATHIATEAGLLSSLENHRNAILVVSGGGGGGSWVNVAGHGGGYIGGSSYKGDAAKYNYGANQETGFKFGMGSDGVNDIGSPGGGGGGGYYGGYGGNSDGFPGSGGSGYIGNSLLNNKVMYCYNCEESNEESTKTISTTCAEATPTENCAKKGNGYARITYIGNDK